MCFEAERCMCAHIFEGCSSYKVRRSLSYVIELRRQDLFFNLRLSVYFN